MATIVTRAGKGSTLTWTEADANFTNLNNDKAEKASPTFTGTVVLPSTTSIGDASATEISYLDGVTSAIQTQITAKAPTASPTFTGTVVIPAPFTLGATSVTATGTELNYTDVTTLGTQEASKCVTTDANVNSGVSKITALHIGTSGSETQVTATAAELNYNDITTLGTLAASKTWTSDSSLDTVMPTGGLLTVQSGGTITANSGSTVTLAGTNTFSGATAISGAATFSGAVIQAPVFVPDATPYSVLAANSGKTHIILEQANTITLNLPVIAAGLSYKFIMGGVATEAQNWVIVATTPSYWTGGVVWLDLDDADDNIDAIYGNGSSHLTFTITTPAAGTVIEAYSNGTVWFIHGTVNSATAPAFT